MCAVDEVFEEVAGHVVANGWPGACAPVAVAMVNVVARPPEPVRSKRAAHYLWAVLIARIYEVFPLLCPICGGQMRIIAFITHSADIRQILEHIGTDSEPPHIAPARGRPCGKTVTRGWARVLWSSRNGIWRRKRHPTLRFTSVSTGDNKKRHIPSAAGEAACAAAAQLTCSGYARLWAAAGSQTAELNETKLPKTRGILRSMLENSLSVGKALGSSGGINYCLNALVAKGLVKIESLSQNQNKFGYVYLLTPNGIAEKAALTSIFLKRKMEEYEAPKIEIATLKSEIDTKNGDKPSEKLDQSPLTTRSLRSKRGKPSPIPFTATSEQATCSTALPTSAKRIHNWATSPPHPPRSAFHKG